MAQLVGRLCVHCRERIGSESDGYFCPKCSCPVHAVCVAPARERNPANSCATCGAPAAVAEPSRVAAAEQANWAANYPARRKAGCAIAASGAWTLFALLQLLLRVSREPAPDVGELGNAVIGFGLGLAAFLISLVVLARTNR